MEMVQLLVHNLSHADLVLDVRNHSDGQVIVARPKFSHFRTITETIVRRLEDVAIKTQKISYFPLETRVPVHETPQHHVPNEIPVGFNFEDDPILIENPAQLRFNQNTSAPCSGCSIVAAYFPLVAALLPKWLLSVGSSSSSSAGADTQLVVLLVTGRGTPTDLAASMSDNSTKFTGRLITKFIESQYQDRNVQLQHIHSATNLFRYDENIIFVKQELLPVINRYRDALVCDLGAKWKDCMHITLSFADGSSARTSAINASLKHYRPSYMHFWQLKSFWRGKKIYEDDIEFHTNEEIATVPAVLIRNAVALDPQVQAVIQEMGQFREDFTSVMQGSDSEHDLFSFWLRKTRKPVLAVLLVQKPGQPHKLYRGTNMEVSMPTGSLCAERNVIGSALADDVTLRRQDLKLIAVYSWSSTALQSKSPSRSRRPSECAASPSATNALEVDDAQAESESSGRISRSNSNDAAYNIGGGAGSPIFAAQRRKILSMPATPHQAIQSALESSTVSSFFSANNNFDAAAHDVAASIESKSGNDTGSNGRRRQRSSSLSQSGGRKRQKRIAFQSPGESITTAKEDEKSNDKEQQDSISLRKLTSSRRSESADERILRQKALLAVPTATTIVVDESDLNPLKPCGACNEWLKKIAEVNPNLRVITFTDADCCGVYIENVDDS